MNFMVGGGVGFMWEKGLAGNLFRTGNNETSNGTFEIIKLI